MVEAVSLSALLRHAGFGRYVSALTDVPVSHPLSPGAVNDALRRMEQAVPSGQVLPGHSRSIKYKLENEDHRRCHANPFPTSLDVTFGEGGQALFKVQRHGGWPHNKYVTADGLEKVAEGEGARRRTLGDDDCIVLLPEIPSCEDAWSFDVEVLLPLLEHPRKWWPQDRSVGKISWHTVLAGQSGEGGDEVNFLTFVCREREKGGAEVEAGEGGGRPRRDRSPAAPAVEVMAGLIAPPQPDWRPGEGIFARSFHAFEKVPGAVALDQLHGWTAMTVVTELAGGGGGSGGWKTSLYVDGKLWGEVGTRACAASITSLGGALPYPPTTTTTTRG